MGDPGGDDLSSLLTIVIVTSPVSSNPSTELLDRCLVGVVRSFPSTKNCRIVVACDGVQVLEATKNTQSRRKCSTTRIYGKCNQDQWNRYDAYCKVLEKRPWLHVDRQEEWKGFAMTLRSAIQNRVSTPLVMVLPHDYELTSSNLAHIHLPMLLHEMQLSADINYIGLPNPRSSKFGTRHRQSLKGIPNRIVQSSSSSSSHDDNMIRSYTLEPLAMWKENPHFAKVDAYESVVFGPWRYKRGHFIEDTLGQHMLSEIKERGLAAFHFTYLLSLPTPCSFHMDGPRYLPILERQKRQHSIPDFDIESAKLARDYVVAQKQMNRLQYSTGGED